MDGGSTMLTRPAGAACPSGADWSWPPSGPVGHPGRSPFTTDEWAPASTVRHPWVRVGRWTLLYRRAG
ncbi:hypothetical protein [Blastococcus sp. SYSU D00820]